MTRSRVILSLCLSLSVLGLSACARSGPPAPVDVRGVGSGQSYPGQQVSSNNASSNGGSEVVSGYTPPPGYGASSVSATPLGEVNDAYSQTAAQPAGQGAVVLPPPDSATGASAPTLSPTLGAGTTPASVYTPPTGASVSPSVADATLMGSGPFAWPLRGTILSEFGPQPGGQKNDGLNISAPLGTTVYAAKEGTVSYVGNELKGFGTMILLKHEGGMFTVYAHLSSASVTKGQTISKGQSIGAVGQTGQVTAPQLHFEVRRGSTPLDPRKYLSK